MTSRNYCFTSYCLLEVQELKNIAKYMIFGVETCPSTGKIHYQGYIDLTSPMRIAALKKHAPTTHFEKRKGTWIQAVTYCKKEELYYEFGTPSKGPGERTDLNKMKEDLKTAKKMKEIADENFGAYLRYNRGMEKFRALWEEPRKERTELEIYWGKPGTGKSKRAHEENPEAYWLPKPNGGSVFFDGYDGQETVIIDDFYGWLPFDLLLRMADRYPLRVNTKGGSVNFNPKKIIITSNKCPKSWYPNVSNFDALERRIDACIEY